MDKFISVKINDRKLLREMPKFFSQKYAFISELAQNAYRSGATELTIKASSDIVSFSDNGHGIDDPSVLLTIAESGWENAGIEEMDPAGMGIFSAFFAGNRVEIKSLKDGKGWYIYFITDDILSQRPIEVFPIRNQNGLQGTTVTLYGSFDLNVIEREVKERIRYYNTIKVTYNGDNIEQNDFLESDADIAYRKELTAGKLALYNKAPYGQYTNSALFHGQIIPLMKDDLHRGVPYCRLVVKGLGLTPRLPDRTAFVEDDEYANFIIEFKEAVREALLTEALEITPALAIAYLTEADRARLAPQAINITLDGYSIDIPAYPWFHTDCKRTLSNKPTNIAEFDIIIKDDWDDDQYNHTVIAALYWLHEEGQVRVGIVNSAAADASLSPLLHERLMRLEDFEIITVFHGSKTKDLPFSLSPCSLTLKDRRSGRLWQVKGVVPATDFNDLYNENIAYCWSFEQSPHDTPAHTLYNHLLKVTALCCCISDEDEREHPYDEEFDCAVGKTVMAYFSPQDTFHGQLISLIKDFIADRFGWQHRDIDDITINLKNGHASFKAEGKDDIFILDKKGLHKKAKPTKQ